MTRPESAVASERRPTRVILFLVDDMGWGDVGCMGHPIHDTPHIDRLAAEGVLFRAAYANAPNCAPSRACLLTGSLPPRHGIYTVGSSARGKAKDRRWIPIENKTRLDQATPTLASILKAHGYATASIGKWHLGDDPCEHGFDLNIGGNKGGNPRSHRAPYANPNLVDGPDGEYLTTRLTDEAVRFIEDHAQQPFFLYLSHYGVHTPLQGDPQWLSHFDGKARGKHRQYASMVKSIDESLGRVRATLEKTGLADETLIIFFSDNGGHAGATTMAPLRGSKGMLYEGGIRVPLIAWHPNSIAAAVDDTPVQGTDLLPTILAALGVPPADAIEKVSVDGNSLWPLLTRKEPLAPRPLYWHFPAYLEGYASTPRPWRTTPAGAIRLGRYKLLEFFGDKTELYDLETDIGEQRNLLNTEPARAQALLQRLQQWRQQVEAPVPTRPNPRYRAPSSPSASATDIAPGDREKASATHDVHGHFHFDSAEALAPSTAPFENPLLHSPHVCADSTGVLWFTQLEFEPGRGQRVSVTRLGGASPDDSGFVPPSISNDSPRWVECFKSDWGRYSTPTLTLVTQGMPHLSYEAECDSGDWHLFVQSFDEHGTPKPRIAISPPSSARALHHTVAATPEGGLVFAWQGERFGMFEIFVRYCTPSGSLGDVTPMGVAAGDWRPSIVARSDGSWVVAWDAYRDSYDIMIREYVEGAWQPIHIVAESPALEARVQLARDRNDRVYVAWEQGGRDWGKEYRSLDKTWNNNHDHYGPLHRFRKLHFGIWTGDGVREIALPQPSLQHGERRPGGRPGVRYVGAFYERCELTVDATNRPWIFYRHYYDPQLGVTDATVHHIEVGWKIYARALTAAGWSPLQRFEIPQRDGNQRLSVAPWKDTVVAVWGTGRRDRRADPEPKGIVFGAIPRAPSATQGSSESTSPRLLDAPPMEAFDVTTSGRAFTPPRETTHTRPSHKLDGGVDYVLFRGDLHRHTDLSLCFPFFDGSLEDAYRYAIDAAQLDFLAVTDHTRDLEHGQVDGLMWWRNTNAVRQYTLGRRFIPLVGFERSHRDTDHNVISLREDHLRDFPPPLAEYWAQIDADTFTIPHAPFIGRVWEQHDDLKRPLLEIFQGFRDTEALTEAHKALARGYHLGFIASSDHLSTHSSYAGVWTPSPSREDLFRSLQARRTYGATADITLKVLWGEHWMGSRVQASQLPAGNSFRIEIQGTAPLAQVSLYRQGDIRRQWGPLTQSDVQLEVDRDVLLAAGAAGDSDRELYFTVVVTQTDGNKAWASPIWVRKE